MSGSGSGSLRRLQSNGGAWIWNSWVSKQLGSARASPVSGPLDRISPYELVWASSQHGNLGG